MGKRNLFKISTSIVATAIEIQPLLKLIISIVVEDVFYYKNHWNTTTIGIFILTLLGNEFYYITSFVTTIKTQHYWTNIVSCFYWKLEILIWVCTSVWLSVRLSFCMFRLVLSTEVFFNKILPILKCLLVLLKHMHWANFSKLFVCVLFLNTNKIWRNIIKLNYINCLSWTWIVSLGFN